MSDFKLSGRELRKQGINRFGNLLVPNKNYCQFEDWMTPLIENVHDEQDAVWLEWSHQFIARNQESDKSSPPDPASKVIERLGREMHHHEDSFLANRHDDSVLTYGQLGTKFLSYVPP